MVDVECIHPFQHVIEKGIQYCLDCRKTLWGTGENGVVLEKDQKTANKHKCSSKNKKRKQSKYPDFVPLSDDFFTKNS